MPYTPDNIDWSQIWNNNNPDGSQVQVAKPAIPNTVHADTSGGSDAPQGWADLATILGNFSSGEKANRALEGQFTQNYDRLKLEAQQDRRAQETDAQHKLSETGYILGGGSHFNPGSIQLNGKDVPVNTFGMAPPAPSDAQKAGATTLQAQMLDRLKPSGSMEPTPLNNYAKPGLSEKIGSWGGAITGGIGAVSKLAGAGGTIARLLGLGGGGGAPAAAGGAGGGAGGAAGGSFLSGMPGGAAGTLGLAAGAGLGAYGVYKNHSKGADIGSGALSGGSIGTMIMPGIGTAVGAGIGAGVGALRHAFGGPDSIEKEGRGAASDTFNQIGSQATPEQKQQAQSAGWSHPEEALAYIVMSDALRAKGQPTTQADQWMKSIYDAEKHGGKQVASAVSPIQQMMAGRG